jgi:hypothetical protein
LKSGISGEEYFLTVLDKMYEEMTELHYWWCFETINSSITCWTFHGWMTFVAFTKSVASGSQNPHHLSIIFGKEDPKKNEENGRQAMWDVMRRNKRVETA